MMRLMILFLSLVLAFPAHAASPLDNLVEGELPSLVSAYQRLHANPELSYKEEKTSLYLAKELRAMGYDVAERVGKYPDPKRTSYGVVAVLKNGAGPTALIRAEMDALPIEEKTGLPYASKVRAGGESGGSVGVMHACGHDLHMAAFLGAAKMLARLKDGWRGTVVLVGEPAEEVSAGSLALLEDGLYERFPRPDFVFTLHDDPGLEAGKLGYREGYLLANSNTVDILVHGRGGHGAMPHLTKDPIVLAAQLVLAFQTIVSREISPLDPSVVTVGMIQGGTRSNVIPDDVRLKLSVRSYKAEVRDKIFAAIRRICTGLAVAAGLPVELHPEVKIKDTFSPAVYNDPALTRRLTAALQKEFGASNVVEAEPVMLGDNFSRYGLEGRKIPISMFRLGAGEPAKVEDSRKTGAPMPALHSAEFAPDAGPAIRTGAKAFVAVILELLKKE